jgi:putative transposase
LLGDLTKRVLEAGLEVEMDEHLGYAKHASEGRNGGNSRNGTRSKTVMTEVGPGRHRCATRSRWQLRTQDGAQEPAPSRRVDAMVISLTAKWLTTREVEAHLADVYSTEITRETISKITDRVLDDMTDWQNRPPTVSRVIEISP